MGVSPTGGSTHLSEFGFGTAGNVAIWPGAPSKESVMFGVTLDGGSSADYRVYSPDAPTSYPDGDPVYSSATRNNSDAYYTGFGGESARPLRCCSSRARPARPVSGRPRSHGAAW